MIHRRKHPTYVDGCFGCKLVTLNIAPSVAETTEWGRKAKEVRDRERRWDRDMPAYKRMRANGLQPKHIDGSADIESRATTEFEVVSGRVYDGKQGRQLREALSVFEDTHHSSPLVPVTSPSGDAA